MTRFLFVLMFSCLSAEVAIAQQASGARPSKLFNGKDFTGWQGFGGPASQNWKVEKGVLSCTGEAGASWIYYEKEFSDFELELEFNLPANANSGVFIRAPKTGDPWVTGIEIQLLDDFGDKWKGLQPDQYTGAIYAAVGPTKRVTQKAGQWQTMKIRCLGDQCQVWVNDQPVVDANLAELAKKFGKKIPGLKRKKGLIGLQNHGDKVSFREITVQDLSAANGQ